MMRIAVWEIGMDLSGTIVSLDGVYDCRVNRKAIFNRGMELMSRWSSQRPKSARQGSKPPRSALRSNCYRRSISGSSSLPSTWTSHQSTNCCYWG